MGAYGGESTDKKTGEVVHLQRRIGGSRAYKTIPREAERSIQGVNAASWEDAAAQSDEKCLGPAERHRS